MKPINNYISERLNPRHLGAANEYYAYVVDKETIVICDNLTAAAASYDNCRIEPERGNLAMISWCDDNIYGYIIKDMKSEADLKNEVIKYTKDWVKTNGDDGTDFMNEYHTLPCGVVLYGGIDNGKLTGERVWKEYLKWLNYTYVDGDSSYCVALIDLKEREVIAGGGDVLFEY